MTETLGEYRVGKSFNPSGFDLVDQIKAKAAELIDLCHAHPTPDSEVGRLWSLAATHFEDGAMWAVKAATKKEERRMNYDQITGVLRALIPAICAYFVGKGYITSDTVGLIVSAAVAVGAAVWSIFNNQTGKVIK